MDTDFQQEDINLDILGPAAEQATAEATMSGRLYKTPECCIIVQCPCIAMRYPTDGDQVKHVQLSINMSNKSRCVGFKFV